MAADGSMSYDEFKTFIRPLAVHFTAVKDDPAWRLYHAALMVDPAPPLVLLVLARMRAAAHRKYFPRPVELREDCEIERIALLAKHPYERCDACRDNAGWITIRAGDVERVAKCGCWHAHRMRLATLGVTDRPIALLGAGEPTPAEEAP